MNLKDNNVKVRVKETGIVYQVYNEYHGILELYRRGRFARTINKNLVEYIKEEESK